MSNLIHDICIVHNVEYDESIKSTISNHINKAPSYIRLGINVLLFIDYLLRMLTSILFIKSTTYTIFIITNKPPILSLLYKLNLYVILIKRYG